MQPAVADERSKRAVTTYAISAQSLDGALADFGAQSGLRLLIPADIAHDLSSPGLTGRYSATEALAILLAGSKMTYRFTHPDTVHIKAADPMDELMKQARQPLRVADTTPETPEPPKPEPTTVQPEMTVTASPLDETGYNVLDATTATKTGTFSTWGLDHTLLIGADYYDSGFDEDGVNLGPEDGVASINIFNPIYGRGVLSAADRPNNFSFRIEDSWYGFYVQDQVRFAEHWHLLVGGRYDDASSGQSFVADRSDFAEDNDSEVTPRAGLLYHPFPWLSLYGSYVEGYNHANFGRTTDGTDLEPERSQQYEAGVKGEWWDGKLTSTLAFYHLTKQNITVPHPDPALRLQNFVEQVGEARSQGIELDIHGELSEAWSLIGSYAYTDVKITEDRDFDAFGNPTAGNKGNRLHNVPEHAGSLWIQHKFIELGWPDLSAGAGVFLASEREGDLENTFQLPGYARLDAALKYSRKVGPSKVTVQFNVNNLLDEEYFVAARSRSIVTPAEPRAFLGSIRLEF